MKLTFNDKNVRKVQFGKLKLGDCFMTSTADDDVYMRISPMDTESGEVNAIYLNSTTLKFFKIDAEIIPVRSELTIFTR